MAAFEHFGGVPNEILYDRMKTAVLGEPDADLPVIYNGKLLSCSDHHGFTPRACQPDRAQTKRKIASDSNGVVEASQRIAHRSISTTNRIYRREPQTVEALNRSKD